MGSCDAGQRGSWYLFLALSTLESKHVCGRRSCALSVAQIAAPLTTRSRPCLLREEVERGTATTRADQTLPPVVVTVPAASIDVHVVPQTIGLLRRTQESTCCGEITLVKFLLLNVIQRNFTIKEKHKNTKFTRSGWLRARHGCRIPGELHIILCFVKVMYPTRAKISWPHAWWASPLAASGAASVLPSESLLLELSRRESTREHCNQILCSVS